MSTMTRVDSIGAARKRRRCDWCWEWIEIGLPYRPRKGDGDRPIGSGDTPLQAAMRCIVDLHSAGAPK